MHNGFCLSRVISRYCAGIILVLLSSATLYGQELGNISGQLRLVNGSFPTERVLVTLQGRGAIINSIYCDSEGRFGFYNLVPNPYYVIIEGEGYQPVRHPVNVVPTVAQTNLVHIVLTPLENSRASPEAAPAANPNLIDVSEYTKKFAPGVVKEFEAGVKADGRGDGDAAIRHYQAAIRQAPDFYPARNNLGVTYLKKHDLKAAEAEFRQVIELNRNSSQGYLNLGNVLYLTLRNEEARETLQEGLRKEPRSAMGYYLLGSVQARLGDLGAAENHLKTARDLDPKLPQVPIALATLYLQTGRKQEAIDTFQSFLQQFPKDPLVPKVKDALSKLERPRSE
jgi:tetratricopeptide (TPR) repeat protein